MKRLFTISIMLIYSLGGYSQNLSDSMIIDSLKKIEATSIEDTNKVNALLDLLRFIQYPNDEVLQYANHALTLTKKLNFKRRLPYCFYRIAEINTNLDNRYEAIKNYYAALKLLEELGDKAWSALCLERIGLNYLSRKSYKEASDAFLKGIKLSQEFTGPDAEYTNAFCHIFLAKIFLLQKNFKQALAYNSLGLKISIAINDNQLAASAYTGIGDIIIQQIYWEKFLAKDELQSLKEAQRNYFASLNNFRAYGDKGGMGDEFAKIAFVYIKLNNFSEAQKFSDSALLSAGAIQFKDNFEESYLVQTQLDSAMGNFKRAFESYKQYVLYRDSIVNDENVKKALQSSMQYEFDKKESVAKAAQDIKDANAKRNKNQQYFAIAALGIVVLAVVIIAMIQFRNNKHRQKANALLQQQKTKVETTLTELKSTQAQLIQSEKMASLGELTAGIAHEIQNPLNFVNNFSEVNKELLVEMNEEIEKGNLSEVKSIAKDVIDNEEKISHHGKRADAIVKGMLQHSQSSTGKKEPIDVNALADEYLRLSYHGFRAKDKLFDVTLKTDFDESIGKINIIPQDIGRVLLNLYNNAFYTLMEKKKSAGDDYEPTVSVSTKGLNGKVEIRVKDNGNGVAEKVLGKIFQPFFTTKPTGQGTGLGLSLSYDIIKAHGGEIKVETKEGEESEFIIQLPLKNQN